MQRDNPQGPIARVTEGMRVVDADGEEVGVVDIVSTGDPNAVTVQAPTGAADGALADEIAATALEEPDVPADVAARLLRGGYLKVDGEEPFDVAVYVEVDQIAEVGDNVVQLSVPTADLTPQK